MYKNGQTDGKIGKKGGLWLISKFQYCLLAMLVPQIQRISITPMWRVSPWRADFCQLDKVKSKTSKAIRKSFQKEKQ